MCGYSLLPSYIVKHAAYCRLSSALNGGPGSRQVRFRHSNRTDDRRSERYVFTIDYLFVYVYIQLQLVCPSVLHKVFEFFVNCMDTQEHIAASFLRERFLTIISKLEGKNLPITT